jgi:ribosomal protein S18 acetylase RimI-like enzyme
MHATQGSDAAGRSELREWRNGPFEISTDRARLDVALVHGFLTREFWDTEGIPRAVVERAIAHSLCFGIYEGERQVGFARVVTDRATFAFVSDDFVLESHRGRGLGRWLMQSILAHPDLRGLRRIMLVTHDPRLYLKSGFRPLKEPGTYMEILDPDAYGGSARPAP